MIIDADTHISPYKTDEYDISIDELIRRMDYAGIDKSIVWLRPPYMREVAESNLYVRRAMRDHPDRVIGFGWVDPHLDRRAMLDEIKRCHEEYGMHGIKLNGAQNDFYIDGDLAAPFEEEIANRNLVMAFHIGVDAYEGTHPYRLGKVARRHPNCRIFMIHMGGVAFHDMSNAAIEVMTEHPNIMGIASAIRPISVLKALKRLDTSRVAFGSDTPFNLMHVELAATKAMMEPEFSNEQIEDVLGGNIARFVGLAGPKAAAE